MNDFALAFFQASIGCALVGVLVWALLTLSARLRPALAMQRSVWLLAQAVIAASFLLALLPESAQWRVLPAIEIAQAVPAAEPGRLAHVDEAAQASGAGHDDLAEAGLPVLLAQAWLALYGAGLLAAGVRLLMAQRSLRCLLASARRLSVAELGQHAAFADDTLLLLARRGMDVFETPAAISPMLVGLLKPRLLLPQHLRSFNAAQQQLIVAHELTHWRRHDLLLVHASIALQTLLWFNPVLRALGKRLSWAQELSCDQLVLAGRSQHQRQQYAAALVSQLKVQQSVFGAALAFGEVSAASLVARVRLIRQSASAPAGMLGKAAVMAMLALLLGASLVLQPALAWRVEMPPAPPSVAAEPVLPTWRQPLAAPRVSSFFGVQREGGSKRHTGIDFAAPTGTPVMATANGVVIDSTDRFERGAKYGKVIVIEHVNGLRSLYAHLERRSVQIGERVGAGQVIGLSGATGKVSGAHLHLEVTANLQHIDPARLIAGLDQNAFSSALRKRAAPVIH